MMALVKDVLITMGLFITIVGGVVAVLNYRTNVKLNRAKWLLDLHQIFFLEASHKEIRQKIDQSFAEHLEPKIRKVLQNESMTSEEQSELQRLDDYLNFFEFILYLKERRLRQISQADLGAMFQYYIDRLKDPEFQVLRDYIKQYGYENLDRYLEGTRHERKNFRLRNPDEGV